MAKYLVIVESPAKAKTINKYLGSSYTVTASMGHMRDLPKSSLGVDIENGFEPKYITIRGKGELLTKLKKDAKNADKVYLATDPDREGEAISWHLAQLLAIDENEKCRITFNEVTKSAVTASLKEARTINMDLVDAQQARRVLDRIVGYKISPLLWRKVRKGLSAGRVQSVATRLIVDREHEIEAFDPKEYWSITAELCDEKGKNKFEARFYGMNGKSKELNSKEETDAVLSTIADGNYVVTDIREGTKQKSPAPPFTTSTLQQEASRKLGFTAKRTMSAAQTLYEGVTVPSRGSMGLITYMRTDSQRVAPEAQAQARKLITEKYGNEYLPEKPRFYKSNRDAQDAHEAIRPSDVTILPSMVKETLTADLYKLYKLIWERFVASQMTNAVYSTLGIDVDANGAVFKASLSAIKFNGCLAAYVEGSDEGKEKVSKTFPKLEKNQKLKVLDVNSEQHFTEPPSRYTEASLIKTMEENGIGRPSTYAPTISTILAREYVAREKKMLKPTELGEVVTDLMKDCFKDIVNVEFTANMEKQLDDVEEGSVEWTKLISDFYNPFMETLKEADKKIEKVEIKDEETDEICELCGRNMVIKMGRFGKFLACPGYPECKNAKPILQDTGVKCPKCGGRIVARKSKKGKKYYNCEFAPKCDIIIWDEPLKTPCEKCGGILTKKYTKKGMKNVCINPECENSNTDK